jgi:hypothetical protein
MNLTFDEWLEHGLSNGYCTEQFCDTHDGIPVTESEDRLFEEGYDPCIHLVRLGNPGIWKENADNYGTEYDG